MGSSLVLVHVTKLAERRGSDSIDARREPWYWRGSTLYTAQLSAPKRACV